MNFEHMFNRLSLFDRIELWLEMHNVALYADLTTYYVICCGFGFLSGLATGTQIVRMIP